MLKKIKYIAYTSIEQIWVEQCLEKKMLFDFVSMSPNCYERYSLAFIIFLLVFFCLLSWFSRVFAWGEKWHATVLCYMFARDESVSSMRLLSSCFRGVWGARSLLLTVARYNFLVLVRYGVGPDRFLRS